jgi:cation transport ATPase
VAQLEFADPARQYALDVVARLHAAGIGQVAMVTGDRAEVAEPVGSLLGVDRVYADRTPEASSRSSRRRARHRVSRPS